MWWGPDGGGWAGWFFMALMMVAFWGLLIVLVVWLVRATRFPTLTTRGPLPVERGSSSSKKK